MKNKKVTITGLILSIISCLSFVFVYFIAAREMYSFLRFGKYNDNVKALFYCMIFFIAWLIFLIVRILIKPKNVDENKSIFYKRIKGYVMYITLAIVLVVTCVYGTKVYKDAVSLNGKLSWFLHDLKNKKTVELTHNNIYKNGIDGIFTDLKAEIKMPEKLYISTGFKLNFNSKGTITSFDTFIYGKDKDGQLQSYLISYDSKKSKKIIIYLNGYANADYSDDKLLEPLLKTMRVLHLKDTVQNWKEDQFGILYYGRRSFEYNTEGIVYIDRKGDILHIMNTNNEIKGYFVSIYVPGKENTYIPYRYELKDNLEN